MQKTLDWNQITSSNSFEKAKNAGKKGKNHRAYGLCWSCISYTILPLNLCVHYSLGLTRIMLLYIPFRVINNTTKKHTPNGGKAMTKKTTKKTFKMNGWIYTYNESMTSNWGWPEGRKGERVRILKRQMQQLLKERDYFKMTYTEI